MITIKQAKKTINSFLKELGIEEELFYSQNDTEDVMEILRLFRDFMDKYEGALLQKIATCQSLIHKTDEATCWAVDTYIISEKEKLEKAPVGVSGSVGKPKKQVNSKPAKAEEKSKAKPSKLTKAKEKPKTTKKKEKKNDN